MLKAYIDEHHHPPDKKKMENIGLLWWAKAQRKKIKAGALDEEKTRLFEELMNKYKRNDSALKKSGQARTDGCGKFNNESDIGGAQGVI